MERMFRVIYEKDHYENEMFIHYCQYTGNEAEIDTFCEIINWSDGRTMRGEYSEFYSDTLVLIPESAVDMHIKLDHTNRYAHLFQKHTGTFKCPEFENYNQEEDTWDSYELAREISKLLYSSKLKYLFSDTKGAW